MKDLFAVIDRGTSAFNPPITAVNVSILKRELADLFLQEREKPPVQQHVFVRYPDQFDVYQVGMFDEVTGAIVPLSPVALVLRLSEI